MRPSHSRTPAPRGYLAGPLVFGYTLTHAAVSSATTPPSRWSVLVDVWLKCGNFTGRGVVMGDEVVPMRTCGVVHALSFLYSLYFGYLGY
jgi:hypothetical protein